MFDSFKLCDINMSEKEEKHFSPVIGGSKHYIRQGKAVERPQSKSIWNEPPSEYLYFNLCSIIAPLTKIRQGDIWHGSRPLRQGECCTPEISGLISFTSFDYISFSNLKSGTHDVLIG